MYLLNKNIKVKNENKILLICQSARVGYIFLNSSELHKFHYLSYHNLYGVLGIGS